MLPGLTLTCLALFAQKTVPADAKAFLPTDEVIQILQVVDSNKKAWTASGAKMKYMPTQHLDSDEEPPKASFRRLRIVVGMLIVPSTEALDMPQLMLKIGDDSESVSWDWTETVPNSRRVGSHRRWWAQFSIDVPKTTKATDLSIGFANRNWKTLGTVEMADGKVVTSTGYHFLASVEVIVATDKSKQVNVYPHMPSDRANKTFRIIGFDKKGKQFEGWGDRIQEWFGKEKAWFSSELTDISLLKFQAQTYVWTTFRGVALEPKG